MGVYDPLEKYLKSLPAESLEASFSEIERILDRKLPDSAYDHASWWGNRREGNHGHANAWRDAGWQIRGVDLANRRVRFERIGQQAKLPSISGGRTIDDLMRKAGALTGIEDREELLAEALNALINREMVKFFTEVGGSMPDFKPAPRERPFA